jgi:hypothetical protein
MADFFTVTTGKLNLKSERNVDPNGTSVPNNGPANQALPSVSTKVGPMGDNVASSTPNQAMPKANHKVGATGDRAAK